MEYQPEPDERIIEIVRPVEEPGDDVVENAARLAANLPPKKPRLETMMVEGIKHTQGRTDSIDPVVSAARRAAGLKE
jgi:hypothetical protein